MFDDDPGTNPLGSVVIDGVQKLIHSVRDWIRLEYELFQGNNHREPIRPYDGPKDFVVRLGQDFPFRPLPQGVKRRQPRQCFHNAAALALRRPKEFLYAEGYALQLGICTEHAWCIDREGYVVDPTWRDTDAPLYFGVAFQHVYVRKQARERGELGGLINVWDAQERWPLCTGVHPLGEALADLTEWTRVGVRNGK